MRAVLIFIACVATSEACTCFPFPSLRDAFCYSNFVAHVRVVGRIDDTDSQTVRYNVVYLDTYRNQTESKQLPTEIVTGSTSAACGIELTNRTEYLIGVRGACGATVTATYIKSNCCIGAALRRMVNYMAVYVVYSKSGLQFPPQIEPP